MVVEQQPSVENMNISEKLKNNKNVKFFVFSLILKLCNILIISMHEVGKW